MLKLSELHGFQNIALFSKSLYSKIAYFWNLPNLQRLPNLFKLSNLKVWNFKIVSMFFFSWPLHCKTCGIRWARGNSSNGCPFEIYSKIAQVLPKYKQQIICCLSSTFTLYQDCVGIFPKGIFLPYWIGPSKHLSTAPMVVCLISTQHWWNIWPCNMVDKGRTGGWTPLWDIFSSRLIASRAPFRAVEKNNCILFWNSF